jgi:hypothetical protein
MASSQTLTGKSKCRLVAVSAGVAFSESIQSSSSTDANLIELTHGQFPNRLVRVEPPGVCADAIELLRSVFLGPGIIFFLERLHFGVLLLLFGGSYAGLGCLGRGALSLVPFLG